MFFMFITIIISVRQYININISPRALAHFLTSEGVLQAVTPRYIRIFNVQFEVPAKTRSSLAVGVAYSIARKRGWL